MEVALNQPPFPKQQGMHVDKTVPVLSLLLWFI